MEILGVGVPELIFIVLIALILLGPKDMIAAGRTIGKTLRKFVTSPTWAAMRETGKEIQNLPTRLMREAGIEELKELEKEAQKDLNFSVDPRINMPKFGEQATPDPKVATPPKTEQPPAADTAPKAASPQPAQPATEQTPADSSTTPDPQA